MNILVTGATGFIGSNLTKSLTKLGHNVIALGKKSENQLKNIKVLTKIDQLNQNIDMVFHQAANNNTLENNENFIVNQNLNYTIKLFNKCLELQCKKFVYASSCAVYGKNKTPFSENKTKINPLNPYAISKKLVEQFATEFAKENNVITIGLRCSNVYGKNEKFKNKRASMIYQIIQKAQKKQTIKLFKNGNQKRDWIHVNDVTNANLKLIQYQKSNIFNVGSGEATSFRQLLHIISKQLNQNLKIEYVDCPFKHQFQTYTLCNINKIKNETKWKPKISINKGIKNLISQF